MVKEIVEPMFASMLPGPLATLHFVKLDLGQVPLKVSRVDVHRTEQNGIKLDMDVDWQGKCDFDLDGKMVPKLGVERVHLSGRLSVLLAPLTNIIPLVRRDVEMRVLYCPLAHCHVHCCRLAQPKWPSSTHRTSSSTSPGPPT